MIPFLEFGIQVGLYGWWAALISHDSRLHSCTFRAISLYGIAIEMPPSVITLCCAQRPVILVHCYAVPMALSRLIPTIQEIEPDMLRIYSAESIFRFCFLPPILFSRCLPLVPSLAEDGTTDCIENCVAEAVRLFPRLVPKFAPQQEEGDQKNNAEESRERHPPEGRVIRADRNRSDRWGGG